jgi:hypothetical protein
MAKQPQRQPQQPAPASPKKTAPAPVQRTIKKESSWSGDKSGLLFGRQNFLYMGAGLALVLIGLLAMTGGAMPDPKVWEPERIYSFQRITLAPILMVLGFVAVGIGIFKKSPELRSEAPNDNT